MKEVNPFSKPLKAEKDFGKFEVGDVSTEFNRLSKVNIAKQNEYGTLYVLVAHLFDAAVHLLNVIHTVGVSEKVCRTLALVCQNIL